MRATDTILVLAEELANTAVERNKAILERDQARAEVASLADDNATLEAHVGELTELLAHRASAQILGDGPTLVPAGHPFPSHLEAS